MEYKMFGNEIKYRPFPLGKGMRDEVIDDKRNRYCVEEQMFSKEIKHRPSPWREPVPIFLGRMVGEAEPPVSDTVQ